MIDNVFWNIGPLDLTQYNTDQDKNELYCLERQNNETWQGKIALLLPSDGAYSFNGSSFLNSKTWYWSLRIESNVSSTTGVTFYYDPSTHTISFSRDVLFFRHFSYPTLYLKPNVKIVSGTGSLNDAYKVAQIIK